MIPRLGGPRLAALAALVALAVLHAACELREAAGARGARIVLVTLDTLRLDALVRDDGREAPMARTLERARAKGRIFTRFYASTSTTQPSHASFFTGLHPWEHGVTRNGKVLEARHVTLAERLRDAGFATAAVVASSPLVRGSGMEQGFEHFDDALGRGAGRERGYGLGDAVTERAIAAIDAACGPRQFFWIHYFDPHSPYGDAADAEGRAAYEAWLRRVRAMARGEAPREGLARLVDAGHERYRQDVAHLDALLATLFARLDRDADRFETHVLLVSDHGESFGEDGSLGHGTRVTPWQLHVPLVIFSPAFPPGESGSVAGSVDVFPSVLALAGLDPPEGRGRDLAREGPAAGAVGMRRSYDAPHEELRLDGTLHVHDGVVLYAVDPAGRLVRAGFDGGRPVLEGDVAPEGPEREALLARFEGIDRALRAGSAPDVGEEAQLALEALGYVR